MLCNSGGFHNQLQRTFAGLFHTLQLALAGMLHYTCAVPDTHWCSPFQGGMEYRKLPSSWGMNLE